MKGIILCMHKNRLIQITLQDSNQLQKPLTQYLYSMSNSENHLIL